MANQANKSRKLALLFSDIVGYSSKIAEDEAKGIELLTEYRLLVRRTIPMYGGREQDTTGDGFFVEFGNVLESVKCAIEIQNRLHERNLLNPSSRHIKVRIGIHYGDVVAFEDDTLVGDSVNLASRVESFAAPGGVCVTEPVVKEIADDPSISFRKMGKREIKGFPEPVELCHLVAPWDEEGGSPFSKLISRVKTGGAISVLDGSVHLTGILMTVLMVFGFFITKTYEGLQTYSGRTLSNLSSRGPASTINENPRIPLDGAWEFATSGAASPLQLLGQEKELRWLMLDVRNSWKQTEKLSAPYWLKKNFPPYTGSLKHPALVIGLIAGAYRVYLNGIFIGGSNHFFNLSHFAFDPRMLRTDANNQILVQVSPKTSLTPGLRTVPNVGAFVGEFNDVYASVVANEYYYHIFLSVYLVIAFLLFATCAVFYAFNRREKKYLYFSIFLLLGTMELFYYNGLVGSVLDYRLHRVCKLLALSVSSVILLSTYLHLTKNHLWERRNNILAIFWSVVVLGVIFTPSITPEALVARSNYVLISTLVYSIFWVFGVIATRFIALLRERGQRSLFANSIQFEVTVVLFGFLMGMLAYRSLEYNMGYFAPTPILRDVMLRLGSTYPFFFAGMIMLGGLIDYITKNRAATYQEKKDDLVLSIVDYLANASTDQEAISRIHQKIVDFVGAERSTLYLISENKRGDVLKASYLIQTTVVQHHIQKTVYPKTGIIGYVCQSKAPILIRDIGADFRFRDHLKNRNDGKKSSYRTKSCMLFPLMARGRMVGILTLADKNGNEPFSREDFALVNVIAKDLTLLIDSGRLKRALSA